MLPQTNPKPSHTQGRKSKRAIIYARVSTDDQADRGYSLPSQIEQCRQYAERLGAEIILELREDHSGATPIGERPVGKELAAMVKAGSVDIIVIYQVDRLSRDIVDLLATVRMWLRAGVEIHTCDIGKIESELDIVLVIKGWQGSDERKKILERVMRGKAAKARDGKVTGGGVPPYGYRHLYDAHNRPLSFEVVESEAHIVRMIFDWYVEHHYSVKRIALELSKMRIPTPGENKGRFHRKRESGIWSGGRVLEILRSECYAGLWHWYRRIGTSGRFRASSEHVPIVVPAIIDRETWDIAQHQRKLNKIMSKRNVKLDYLLRGMVKCACGSARVGHFHNNHRYYDCVWRTNHNAQVEKKICHGRAVRADWLEGDFWAGLKDFFENYQRLEQLLRTAQEEQRTKQEPKRDELAAIEKLLADCEVDAQDCATAMRHAKGKILQSLELQQDEINARYEELTKRRAVLISELSEHLSDSTVSEILHFAHDVREGMENPDFETMRRNIERLQVVIVVNSEGDTTPTAHYRVECVLGKFEGDIRVRRKRRDPDVTYGTPSSKR